MTTLNRFLLPVAATLALSFQTSRAASLYLSAVAETFGPNASSLAAAPGKPVTYAAVDGGYIESGDPIAGMVPATAPVIESALSEALASRGYQPADARVGPSLVIVYNWGDIRRDSMQLRPANHLKGNDRARLLLVARTANAERIERDMVNDRYFDIKMGAMTRTEADRETLQLAYDDLFFVVVSAYDASALREHNQKLVWQVKLTTRAIGHEMNDALVSLIHYGAPYFGRDEKYRVDLKEQVVPASTVRVVAPIPGLEQPAGIDPAYAQSVVQAEHNAWSGKFAD